MEKRTGIQVHSGEVSAMEQAGENRSEGGTLLFYKDVKKQESYRRCMEELLSRIETFARQREDLLGRNVLSHTKQRIKLEDSAVAKLKRKGCRITDQNLYHFVNDLAGVRVICLFLDDIYTIADFVRQQPDLTVIKVKDFVAKPKNSGYQSLHMILRFPAGQKVELQIRTIAMDFWSVLEYQLQYKKDPKRRKYLKKELYSCAIDVRNMDQRMLNLRKSIEDAE